MTDTSAIQWARVEIFGHRQHVGAISEVERFGGKFLRVADVDSGVEHVYAATAIFSITPMTQEAVDEHVASVRRWNAPRALPAPQDVEEKEDDFSGFGDALDALFGSFEPNGVPGAGNTGMPE